MSDTPTAWYTTREAVKAALDAKTTARYDREVDRCIAAGARQVEAALHRRFYPWTGSRYFDFPTRDNNGYAVEFGRHGLVSLTAVTAAGVAMTPSELFLSPANEGPPFTRAELDLSDNAADFIAGSTFQRNLVFTGLWGYDLTETAVGATAEALDASETAVDVTAAVATAVGVGSVIRIGSERMTVTGRRLLNTGITTNATIANNKGATALVVTDGTAFAQDEVITVESERMRVVDIAGNTLLVERAYDGTVLAAHNSAVAIYSSRTLVVERGALGTTAATASDASTVNLWVPPALVEELNVAYALINLGQRQAGYARTIGEGDSEREVTGRGLAQILRDAKMAHGRNVLMGAV